MTNSILENWFKNMKIVSGMKRPAIMLFDGHDTHLTYNTVQSALENSVIIICIPPSTSHALQLLDVSFFFSIKVKRKKIVLCFNHETRMEAVKKELFSTLIKTLRDSRTTSHLVNGFKRPELWPLTEML